MLLEASSAEACVCSSPSLLLLLLLVETEESIPSSHMAPGDDFYAVMGLNKECSSEELRNTYKKLALRWHPDRCSSSSNSKFVEESKTKFQAIQEAYSVLSDTNKRILYDVGVYDDDDDDDANGMGDFLGEMAAMMRQTKPSENKQESIEELQDLFVEMFNTDINNSFCDNSSSDPNTFGIPPSDCFSNAFTFCNGSNNSSIGNSLKRDNEEMTSGCKSMVNVEMGQCQFGGTNQAFCFGTTESGSSSASGSRRRTGRKQKVSSRHDVSSQDAGISASWIPIDSVN